jgi:glycosyltransferase involved in cell wall biosynthesis
VDRQVAISAFVSHALETAVDEILRPATVDNDEPYDADSRRVLVLQRLEAEKRTDVALRIWKETRLGEAGWVLRVVGDGQERARLTALADELGVSSSVTFAGWSATPAQELARAAVLLATAPGEPYGLSVLEALAAGVPVVAAGSGGHLETLGIVPGALLFSPGDVRAASDSLRALAMDGPRRVELGEAGRRIQRASFGLEAHVESLLRCYSDAYVARSGRLPT